MQIPCSTRPRARQGYVLIITLVFLAISLITLSSVMWWSSSNGMVTQKNVLFTTAESAADAATEQVVATMDRDWTYNQSLQASSVYAALVPVQTNWLMQFQFSNGSNTLNQTGVSIALTNSYGAVGSVFVGLSGYKQLCTITSEATTSNQAYAVSATVQQGIYATIIPLFQFAVFYNMNLEIDPGAAMVMNGPVFSNEGIWAGTPNITFNQTVAAVGLVYDDATDSTNDDPWASGKTDAGTPNGNFAYAPVSGEDSLTLPIGLSNSNSASGVEAIINLPSGTNGAPNSGAYTTNGQQYLFNEADLIISNSANGLAGTRGTNITIWFQDSQNATYLTPLTNDFYALKTGGSTNVIANSTGVDASSNVLYKSYSFVTNVSYYDYRESDTVQAVQLDVSKLNTWINNPASTGGKVSNTSSFNDKGHGIDSVYIYNSVPMNTSQLPAVRLVNGAQLPYSTDPGGSGRATGGLTVVTPQPLYVMGNYNVQTNGSAALAAALTTNTAATYPASIMGDAITILSANWSDNNTSGTGIGSRTPSATTINAACLEGIVQSTNSNYSGGLENFLRLEEDWGNGTVTLQYNGSIVVMFPSIYATNFWPGTGSVYNPPNRQWGFDYNFTVPSKLPPLSPRYYKIIRSSWTDY
jgi:hypothetical protein